MPNYFSNEISVVDKVSVRNQIGVALGTQQNAAVAPIEHLHHTVGHDAAPNGRFLGPETDNVIKLYGCNVHLPGDQQGSNGNGGLHTARHHPKQDQSAHIDISITHDLDRHIQAKQYRQDQQDRNQNTDPPLYRYFLTFFI